MMETRMMVSRIILKRLQKQRSRKKDVLPTEIPEGKTAETEEAEKKVDKPKQEGDHGIQPEGLEEVRVLTANLDEMSSKASTVSTDISEGRKVHVHGRGHEFISESLMKFYKYMGLAPEEEEETHIIKKEVIKIDRAPYYERYTVLKKEIGEETEGSDQLDSQQKYNKKLDAYGELFDVATLQRNAITAEITELKEKRESKSEELIQLFQSMQQREKEIGYGLINTKTGKAIPDKLVDRLIRLQRSLMDTVNTMRLNYIRLKDIVAEKQNKTAILDKIGPNLYLNDYEQLKIENRGLEDKMEERDDEMAKLRSKYHLNVEILAHIREKSAALQSDIDNLKEQIKQYHEEHTQVRGQLTGYKQQRDYYRNTANKLRNESGLLTEMELLRDMEDSMEELNLVTEELDNLKQENKIKAQQIRNIRKNIELSTEVLAKYKSTHKNLCEKPPTQPQLYRGRPSLFKPILPDDIFNDLKNFKFKATFKKNRKIHKIKK
ncbi:hypothetical protein NQ317_006566 [Molorchus minor]|uniref:CCDC113/CCDC96 coiled-coil domain-containing protein n=1 Tax=Molorchus minor TaxID=1323400 RepID=A0ABQ9K3A7_9CUCU|nr:hypothetical protein NQ317_006566 [Molorchus minor]